MPSDPLFSGDYVDAPKPRGRRRKLGWLTGTIATVTLAAFAGVVWHAYNLGIRAGSESVAPLIRADPHPTKMRPESPGGMQVPHRDKTVFETIAPSAGAPPVERLLPPPEAPTPLPEAGATGAEEPPEVAPPATPELTPPSPQLAGQTPSGTPAQPSAQPPTGAGSASAPPAKQEARLQPEDGVYRVQLTALRSREAVETVWRRLKEVHADLLGGLDLNVERADLGPGKGVFFRLQIGPLADRAEARALCDELGQRQQGCQVVKP
ncbi:MAG: SPOR domain-containing protein [Alphaproteobacteria bacterium]